MVLIFFYFPLKVAGGNPRPLALNDSPVSRATHRATIFCLPMSKQHVAEIKSNLQFILAEKKGGGGAVGGTARL